MQLELGFGDTPQTVTIPDRNVAGVLTPGTPGETAPEGELIRRALRHPIGTGPLSSVVAPGKRIAIITSDITRPLPTAKLLPALLDELYAAGARPEDITLVFALGIHRPHTPEEMRSLAGERAFSEISCVDSDPGDFVLLGRTSGGTPVEITRSVSEADIRICLGNIEYHYFAGYSGGAKALMPGVSTRAAIQANHSRMTEPGAFAGNAENNPVRRDIEEAASFCRLDFILNVVLDETKRIVGAFAGHFIEAHRAGCRFLDSIYKVPIERRADIVLVSQGGAPKDMNLYQTQKALDNAKHAVKKGGTVILVGSCREGLGEDVFERWMLEADTPASMIEKIGKKFELGGHKAAAIAMVLENASISLVSELDPAFVSSIFLTPYPTVQRAFDDALAAHGEDAAVLVMPYGGSTLPTESAPSLP